MSAQTKVNPYAFFELRVPKSSETSPEAMAACFQALPHVRNSLFNYLTKTHQALAFEIVTWNQRIYFMAGVPEKFKSYFTSQLTAQYPQALISPVGDYMPYLFSGQTESQDKTKNACFGKLCLAKPFYLPIKTYKDFTEIDPLSTILGALAKADPADKILIQFLVTYAGKRWQNIGYHAANSTIPTSDPEKVIANPEKSIIERKISEIGFNVEIRLMVTSPEKSKAEAMLSNLAGSFASVSHGEGNYLELSQPFFGKVALLNKILERKPSFSLNPHVLTANELATLYHLPNQNLASIKNIAWGGTLKGEAPENLPVALNLSEEQKRDINFFARTEFKNQEAVFGIKRADRRKHIYIIGKTGTGKSTLIANMAINDMRNNEGLAVIDPHGDLCEILLDYIPSFRLNDVVYLDPTNTDRPFRMNPLEVTIPEQSELVASGIVAIFHKLFSYSWGPRLEYILRNTILSLTQIPNTTLLEVPRMLTSESYRNRVMERLDDDILKRFWKNEFNALDARARQEAISPILNKVGQFITSPKIRGILERPQSSINLEDIMDNGKILLLNLSQGKIGEDNAALLGAMFITKIQLAAMNRVNISEHQRRDFYLYVDEFQNFATSSFIKILSEARKYRLNLCVANQYTAQVEEDVQKAIFGNVGTLMSFLLGSSDARLLNQEFGNLYEESDLVSLDNFEIITKLSIDNKTSTPFAAHTLPLPRSKNQNREKAIRISLERYGKKSAEKKIVEDEDDDTDKKDSNHSNQKFLSPTGNSPHKLSPQSSQTATVIPTLTSQQSGLATQSIQPDHELLNLGNPQPNEIIPVLNNPNPSNPTNNPRRQEAEQAFAKLVQNGLAKPPQFNNSPIANKTNTINQPKKLQSQNQHNHNNNGNYNNNKNNWKQKNNKPKSSNNTHNNSETKNNTQTSNRPIFVVEEEKD
jgi:hypothetical protein